MHGGVKFYRGSPSAARSYVEADRSRVDDYYLAEGTGVATRYVATAPPAVGGRSIAAVQDGGTLDGDAYERWVAGYDIATGAAKGRLRTDERGLRFVEVVVNGPKTWSLAATLHPKIAAAYDAAQDRAATEIIAWLAEHATTRVGPRGRQVQVPVEQLEAAVVRHYTSRAGDPHRHLHLQMNARVFAAGRWRGLHSVGVVDSIEAINGIGHAAVACDPQFRETLAAHGYTVDPDSGEIAQLAPYTGAFSARAAQITRNIDRYEAAWRRQHPAEEPGPRLRRAWDRRAWATARPDKVVPNDGTQLAERWRDELRGLGFTPPHSPVQEGDRPWTAIGRINRDAVTDLVLTRLGARRSAWNAADIRGEVERIIAAAGVVTPAPVRRELVEDLTSRTVDRCELLLTRDDVPEHIRTLTSRDVLNVETDLVTRLAARAEQPATPSWIGLLAFGGELDPAQRRVVAALTGTGPLLVIEGAAGAGKTSTLDVARRLVEIRSHRLVVVTPTLKAARAAEAQLGTDAFSAAWLVHQHGYRWDTDSHWTRRHAEPSARARLLPGDLLLVDEAGMLDQDTARALLTIADQAHARVAFVGDRHQLPAVGRGGVLDHAARWARPEACLVLDTVHRFSDPEYAALSLLMRTGKDSGKVFDALHQRGQITIHRSEVERLAAVAGAAQDGGRIIADTREQVTTLNAAIRDQRLATGQTVSTGALITSAGEPIGLGDHITTRRNDRNLGVANRDCWTVAGIGDDGGLLVRGRRGERILPAPYVRQHVELAYATTVHGAQGETVDHAHLLVGEATGAAAAYVGMTRGRRTNTAHLVAENSEDARDQWTAVFARDRADLGPTDARERALENIDRYGPHASPRRQLRKEQRIDEHHEERLRPHSAPPGFRI
ncbi:MobF family relaxase [Nocardioides sp. AX2bis]|uniref:MobF family relaxase n=1 Tax=Nocardioides sp. AX2bis TaxID=2653157 RepID=UPI0012EF7556|nr:MobF family relaxase [Nocardioides sp. AX2bis]VXB44766.1 Conjugative relaxase domain-containing protein, TrwC/TraI family [Nocardioides sp. AX2bis]